MRIGLDARSLHREGVGRYIRELIKALGGMDRENEYIVFKEGQDAEGIELGRNFRILRSVSQTSLHKIPAFLEVLKGQRLDIFHALDHWYAPVKAPCTVITTFHDLMVKTNPSALSLKSRMYSLIATKAALRVSSHIITVSEFNKAEITANYRYEAEKISVIYNGVSEKFRPDNAITPGEFQRKYGIEPGFFFYAGSLRKYKNVETLIRSYAMLPEKTKKGHSLVLASRREHEYSRLIMLAESLGLRGRIHFTGFLGVDNIVDFYNCASVFITLSLYESFCLPVAEAMACGTPVIAPDNLAFPEIADGAAVLTSPMDPMAVANVMQKVLAETSLREKLREKGLEVAKKYNWTRNAKEVVSLYDRFVNC